MDSFLNNNGLGELRTTFETNGIDDILTLHELIKCPEELEKLIPSMGTRLKLRKCLREKDQSLPFIEFVDFNNSFTIDTTKKLSETSQQVYGLENDNINEDNNIINLSADVDQDSDPIDVNIVNNEEPPKKRSKYCKVQDLDINDVLKNHPLGPSIKAIYDANRSLCSYCQSYLCNILVTHLLQAYGLTVVNEDFEVISKKIIQLFPEECSETYYIAPIRKKDSKDNVAGRSKGKLVDKYRNFCAFISRANKSLSKLNSSTIRTASESNDLNDALNSKTWLISNRDKIQVLEHWDLSYILREEDTKNNEYKTLNDIYRNWPILKESDQAVLINRDFAKKFDVQYSDFCDKWKVLFQKVFALYERKLSASDQLLVQLLDSDNIGQDSCNFIKLQILSSLLAPKSHKVCLQKADKKNNKTAKYWKPNAVESAQGLSIHIKLPGDIQNAVLTKQKRMSAMKIPMQPFIIAIGQDITSLEKNYVRADAVMYEVPSFLDALYFIFQIYLVFNVSYPVECENLCYCIQWAIFNIHTNCDVQIPFVYNTLNKLKLLHKNSAK